MIRYTSSRMSEKERAQALLFELGYYDYDVLKITKGTITFEYCGNEIHYFFKKDWFSGRGVKDGRGLHNLLEQIEREI